jgi:subtilisin family serine protease/subtilisin-like proprotein convertase family protein
MTNTLRARSKSNLQRAIAFELMEARRLLATISGTAFYDDDLDGIIDAGEGGVSGWTVYADTNGNGSFDGANSSYSSSNVPLPINDNATFTSNLPISGNGGTVSSVRVTINITHTWLADLDIALISPTGTRVVLVADQGSDGNNYTNTVFDDGAAATVPTSATGAPFTGSYRPNSPLSAVGGQAIDGTWKLEVTDDAGSDTGTLNSWSLNFSSGEPSAASNSAGAFSLANATVGTYPVYLVQQPSWQHQRTSASVTVGTAASNVTGVNFGVRQAPGSISGMVYADYNIDGTRNGDEVGIAGRTVYIDLDNDSQLDAGEPSTLTDSNGAYTFTNLRPGQRFIRTILPNKWFQTAPSVGGLMGLSSVNSNNVAEPNSPKMSYISSQMILSVNDRARLDGALAKLSNRGLRNAVSMQYASSLGKVRGESLLFVNVKAGSDSAKIAQQFSTLAGVNWAQPNYSYADGADPRDYVPNDPSYASQWHHTKMQNNLAWDIAEGEGIKVGVTDDGAQITHPDLVTNLFVNTGEIAGNGIDDDGNGYVDDRNGWDFTNSTTTGTGDNNPNPASTADNHGTHVIGTIGARTNNGIGVAGTAGRATIVPLRFYGTGNWTSTVIYNTYKYAADNGIKVLSTSYNIDGFANDNLFLQAVNYIYDAGVLHFNSAGNNSQANPVRQKFDQSLFVAATTSTDTKASFSNYGTGVDISAPGEDIYSTSTNNGYVLMSGTSMATPNAAAVAALIWSAHPTWTRDQVAAQMLGLADSIDAVNPTYANLLGTGRVNSYRALSQTLAAPKFRAVLGLPAEGGNSVTSPTQVRVQFFNVLDAATANNMANWSLSGAGADDVFGTADDITIPLTLTGNSTTYRIGTNEFLFNIGATLTSGLYRFTASSLTDPFGTALDGNGDGTGGDAFQRTFSISGITVAANTNILPGEDKVDVNFGVRETIAPSVASTVFEFETGLAIKYIFSEDMTPLTDASIAILNTTTGQTLADTAYDVSFDHATKTATIVIDHNIVGGNFVATLVSNNTADLFGNKLDGDSSGAAGGDHSFAFRFVQGDINRDGSVGFDDLLVLAQNYGQSGKTFSQGNVNFDAGGNVNFDDLLLLAQQYGTSAVVASATTATSTKSKSRASNTSVIA